MTTPIPRLDRLMLVSLLVSGFGWLFLMTPPWSTDFGGLGLFLYGAAYVVPASLVMAAVYGRRTVLIQHELLNLLVLWLVPGAMWGVLLAGIDGQQHVAWGPGVFVGGMFIGTPCFAVWQLLALAIRGAWRWKTGTRLYVGDPSESA